MINISKERTIIYSNFSALEADVVSYLRIRIERGTNPKVAYKEALGILSRTDLVKPLPKGVLGAGDLSNPTRKVNNLMREMGHGIIVEGPKVV